jgi:hypothetical protein
VGDQAKFIDFFAFTGSAKSRIKVRCLVLIIAEKEIDQCCRELDYPLSEVPGLGLKSNNSPSPALKHIAKSTSSWILNPSL